MVDGSTGSEYGGIGSVTSDIAHGLVEQRMTRPMENTRLNLLLVWLTAVVWCVEAGASPNGLANYETPPPRTNSIQWEKDQLRIKEQQELYRRRVAIPDTAIGADVPQSDALNDGSSPLKVVAPAETPPNTPGWVQQTFFYTILLVVGGWLVLRKFAPEILYNASQRFNSWAEAPEMERFMPENIRAEDEPFDKFLTAFKVGPTAAPPADAPPSIDLGREFYGTAVISIGHQRAILQNIVRETGGLARQKLLSELRVEMSRLKAAADFPDALPVWQMATAMDGLLSQLTDKMGSVTSSALRTVVGGVELLDDLCATDLQPKLLTDEPLKFLVVDDDQISRHALSFALSKAFTKPDTAVDATSALGRTDAQAYDVIFLDVRLPGMDGFELCVKIHESVLNPNTPVVFVTGMEDFNARARSTLSGGNDLMGKPFLTFEVTVKALTLALYGRLHGRTPKLVSGFELLDPLLETFAGEERPTVMTGSVPRAPMPVACSPAMPSDRSRSGRYQNFRRALSTHLGCG